MAKQTKKKETETDSIAAIAALGGKMPPQAIEFEEAVLGALLLDRDAMQEIIDTLKPEHFYKEANRKIFEAMLQLYARMAPIDLLTISNELKTNGDLDFVGGRFYLAQLTNNVSTGANIAAHAQVIYLKYLQRKLISLGTELQKNGWDETIDVKEAIESAEGALFELSQGAMGNEITQIAPVISDAIRSMEQAATKDISGLPSGFPAIDAITSGWQPATLIIIAGRPAMGKTAFVLSMARKMAIEYKIPIAFFSLEMSNLELVKRLMTAETEIVSDKIKSGRLTTEEWKHFNSRIGRLTEAPIFIDDTPGLSVFDLRTKARILKQKHDIRMVIIDYLQLMTASALRPGNRQEEVSMISRSLKGLAKELNIPVVALSQLNRNVEGRGNNDNSDGKRPQLSDLRESGAIEQDADIVGFLHRPEYYKIYEDAKGNSLIGKGYFIFAKHRSGKLDDVLLRWQGEFVRFENDDPSASSFAAAGGSDDNRQVFVSKMSEMGSQPSPTDIPNDPLGSFPDSASLQDDGVPF